MRERPTSQRSPDSRLQTRTLSARLKSGAPLNEADPSTFYSGSARGYTDYLNEQLANAGVLLAADGLQPSSKGTRLKFGGPRPTVTDGPFAETKELIAGFWIIAAKSREEAVTWISRAPFKGDEEVEIRPIYEAEDFGPVMTPEIRAQEERLRAKLTVGE
jgi:hypothetical protein